MTIANHSNEDRSVSPGPAGTGGRNFRSPPPGRYFFTASKATEMLTVSAIAGGASYFIP